MGSISQSLVQIDTGWFSKDKEAHAYANGVIPCVDENAANVAVTFWKKQKAFREQRAAWVDQNPHHVDGKHSKGVTQYLVRLGFNTAESAHHERERLSQRYPECHFLIRRYEDKDKDPETLYVIERYYYRQSEALAHAKVHADKDHMDAVVETTFVPSGKKQLKVYQIKATDELTLLTGKSVNYIRSHIEKPKTVLNKHTLLVSNRLAKNAHKGQPKEKGGVETIGTGYKTEHRLIKNFEWALSKIVNAAYDSKRRSSKPFKQDGTFNDEHEYLWRSDAWIDNLKDGVSSEEAKKYAEQLRAFDFVDTTYSDLTEQLAKIFDQATIRCLTKKRKLNYDELATLLVIEDIPSGTRYPPLRDHLYYSLRDFPHYAQTVISGLNQFQDVIKYQKIDGGIKTKLLNLCGDAAQAIAGAKKAAVNLSIEEADQKWSQAADILMTLESWLTHGQELDLHRSGWWVFRRSKTIAEYEQLKHHFLDALDIVGDPTQTAPVHVIQKMYAVAHARNIGYEPLQRAAWHLIRDARVGELGPEVFGVASWAHVTLKEIDALLSGITPTSVSDEESPITDPNYLRPSALATDWDYPEWLQHLIEVRPEETIHTISASLILLQQHAVRLPELRRPIQAVALQLKHAELDAQQLNEALENLHGAIAAGIDQMHLKNLKQWVTVEGTWDHLIHALYQTHRTAPQTLLKATDAMMSHLAQQTEHALTAMLNSSYVPMVDRWRPGHILSPDDAARVFLRVNAILAELRYFLTGVEEFKKDGEEKRAIAVTDINPNKEFWSEITGEDIWSYVLKEVEKREVIRAKPSKNDALKETNESTDEVSPKGAYTDAFNHLFQCPSWKPLPAPYIQGKPFVLSYNQAKYRGWLDEGYFKGGNVAPYTHGLTRYALDNLAGFEALHAGAVTVFDASKENVSDAELDQIQKTNQLISLTRLITGEPGQSLNKERKLHQAQMTASALPALVDIAEISPVVTYVPSPEEYLSIVDSHVALSLGEGENTLGLVPIPLPKSRKHQDIELYKTTDGNLVQVKTTVGGYEVIIQKPKKIKTICFELFQAIEECNINLDTNALNELKFLIGPADNPGAFIEEQMGDEASSKEWKQFAQDIAIATAIFAVCIGVGSYLAGFESVLRAGGMTMRLVRISSMSFTYSGLNGVVYGHFGPGQVFKDLFMFASFETAVCQSIRMVAFLLKNTNLPQWAMNIVFHLTAVSAGTAFGAVSEATIVAFYGGDFWETLKEGIAKHAIAMILLHTSNTVIGEATGHWGLPEKIRTHVNDLVETQQMLWVEGVNLQKQLNAKVEQAGLNPSAEAKAEIEKLQDAIDKFTEAVDQQTLDLVRTLRSFLNASPVPNYEALRQVAELESFRIKDLLSEMANLRDPADWMAHEYYDADGNHYYRRDLADGDFVQFCVDKGTHTEVYDYIGHKHNILILKQGDAFFVFEHRLDGSIQILRMREGMEVLISEPDGDEITSYRVVAAPKGSKDDLVWLNVDTGDVRSQDFRKHFGIAGYGSDPFIPYFSVEKRGPDFHIVEMKHKSEFLGKGVLSFYHKSLTYIEDVPLLTVGLKGQVTDVFYKGEKFHPGFDTADGKIACISGDGKRTIAFHYKEGLASNFQTGVKAPNILGNVGSVGFTYKGTTYSCERIMTLEGLRFVARVPENNNSEQWLYLKEHTTGKLVIDDSPKWRGFHSGGENYVVRRGIVKRVVGVQDNGNRLCIDGQGKWTVYGPDGRKLGNYHWVVSDEEFYIIKGERYSHVADMFTEGIHVAIELKSEQGHHVLLDAQRLDVGQVERIGISNKVSFNDDLFPYSYVEKGKHFQFLENKPKYFFKKIKDSPKYGTLAEYLSKIARDLGLEDIGVLLSELNLYRNARRSAQDIELLYLTEEQCRYALSIIGAEGWGHIYPVPRPETADFYSILDEALGLSAKDRIILEYDQHGRPREVSDEILLRRFVDRRLDHRNQIDRKSVAHRPKKVSLSGNNITIEHRSGHTQKVRVQGIERFGSEEYPPLERVIQWLSDVPEKYLLNLNKLVAKPSRRSAFASFSESTGELNIHPDRAWGIARNGHNSIIHELTHGALGGRLDYLDDIYEALKLQDVMRENPNFMNQMVEQGVITQEEFLWLRLDAFKRERADHEKVRLYANFDLEESYAERAYRYVNDPEGFRKTDPLIASLFDELVSGL